MRPDNTFEQYLERSEPYFAAVREAGDLPWFEDPEKRAAAAVKLGLSAETDPLELRRALWERRNR
uniref:Tail assembly chaperone n=1 Tax=Mycolicibacterium phage Alyssa1 TaxID=3240801 RepID=A0AB39U256_9CAUD